MKYHTKSDLIEDELKAYVMPGWREKEYLREQMPEYVEESSVNTYEPISLDEMVDALVLE